MMGFWLLVPLLLIGSGAYTPGWRPQSKPTESAQTSQTPVEILKVRYARGEIRREEYDQMRHDLEG
jgi:uncharacterized membrane protein